jgi:quercetin dioxygenase-like cupin family protein
MSKVYRPHDHDMDYHKKVWGHEIWLANTELYCGKILHLKKGYRCSYHYHKKKDEVFYILTGSILLELNGEEYFMSAGSAVRVFPGDKHRFTGITDATILEISTQHFEDDSFRITKSEKVTWLKKNILDKIKSLK